MGKAAGLTAKRVDALKLAGLYGDGAGLYLRVAPGGSKQWIFRYQRDGRRRDFGLGAVEVYTLAEARQKAQVARRVVADGGDPIDQRRAQRTAAALEALKAMSFRQCAEAYIGAHEAGWRNPKHRAQWPATLTAYVYPVFGEQPVQAIDVGLVMKAIEPLWIVKAETASRVRGRIENILDWATARGYRSGENPARWRGHLENLLLDASKAKRAVREATGRQEHHAALPYAEMSAFLVELRRQDGISARALEFTILTASRTGEVIAARWDEFDLAAKLWTVPGARMKAGKEHRVALSEAAIAIVEELAKVRAGDYVFPGRSGGKPLSNMAFLMLLRRMGRDDLTGHGFRSTFRDWAAERSNFPAEVAELALAHTVGSAVELAYRRGDMFEKRRQLAEAWARFCASPAPGGEVVAIRRGRGGAS